MMNMLKNIPEKIDLTPNHDDLIKLLTDYSTENNLNYNFDYSESSGKSLTRAEFSFIIDSLFNPFETISE